MLRSCVSSPVSVLAGISQALVLCLRYTYSIPRKNARPCVFLVGHGSRGSETGGERFRPTTSAKPYPELGRSRDYFAHDAIFGTVWGSSKRWGVPLIPGSRSSRDANLSISYPVMSSFSGSYVTFRLGIALFASIYSARGDVAPAFPSADNCYRQRRENPGSRHSLRLATNAIEA